MKKPPKGELSPAQIKDNKHLSGIRSAVERAIAHLKNWKILAIGYRRPLRKLALCLAAVAALEFYRLNWVSSELMLLLLGALALLAPVLKGKLTTRAATVDNTRKPVPTSR